MKVINWNEYISITLLFIKAKNNSIQIKKSQADISLLAVVRGLLVDISRPAKNDCEIPMYNTGSILTIAIFCNDIFISNIAKTRHLLGIFDDPITVKYYIAPSILI